jgi:hypothetical protein
MSLIFAFARALLVFLSKTLARISWTQASTEGRRPQSKKAIVFAYGVFAISIPARRMSNESMQDSMYPKSIRALFSRRTLDEHRQLLLASFRQSVHSRQLHGPDYAAAGRLHIQLRAVDRERSRRRSAERHA